MERRLQTCAPGKKECLQTQPHGLERMPIGPYQDVTILQVQKNGCGVKMLIVINSAKDQLKMCGINILCVYIYIYIQAIKQYKARKEYLQRQPIIQCEKESAQCIILFNNGNHMILLNTKFLISFPKKKFLAISIL